MIKINDKNLKFFENCPLFLPTLLKPSKTRLMLLVVAKADLAYSTTIFFTFTSSFLFSQVGCGP
jgi:hypothetical protein